MNANYISIRKQSCCVSSQRVVKQVLAGADASKEQCAASSTELSNFSDSLKESVNKFCTN